MDSFITWIGGKKLLRQAILEHFPKEIGRYVEVFGGAGWVLFARDKHADLEIYNDLDSDLVNLFRCAQHHPQELQRALSYTLNSRELFHDFLRQYEADGLTDIQRAARFFMLVKTSYGADHRSYGCIKRNVEITVKYLEDIHKRLSRVVIEHKDFEALIKQHDRPDTLFYLDPPYYRAERYYNGLFEQLDHLRLSNALQDIKGRFILSYNDHDAVRDLYDGYRIIEVCRNHNLRNRYNGENEYRELLIMNY